MRRLIAFLALAAAAAAQQTATGISYPATAFVNSKVAAPGASPGTGTFTSAPTVTLSDATPGATLVYTLTGAAPTCSGTGTTYTAPFSTGGSPPATITLKVIGCYFGFTDSTVATFVYTLNSGNVFTLVSQSTASVVSIATTGTSVTIPSTGAGHLLILNATNNNGGARYITGVTGWTCSIGTQASDGSAGAVSGCYLLSSSSGTTTITATSNATDTYTIVVYEYSFTGGATTLDVAGFIDNAIPGATLSGPSLPLGSTGDVVTNWCASGSAAASSVASPFAHLIGAHQGSFADHINTTSGTGGVFTYGSSTAAVCGGLAFK